MHMVRMLDGHVVSTYLNDIQTCYLSVDLFMQYDNINKYIFLKRRPSKQKY